MLQFKKHFCSRRDSNAEQKIFFCLVAYKERAWKLYLHNMEQEKPQGDWSQAINMFKGNTVNKEKGWHI